MRTILFCLSHAGGSAALYGQWGREFCDEIQVVALEYPGRGSRCRETLYGNFAEGVDDLVTQVVGRVAPGRRYALFGHSMGATMAYEIYRRLQGLHYLLPSHVFLSGKNPPDEEVCRRDVALDESSLTTLLTRLGGIPPELMDNMRFLKRHLEVFRSDLELLDTYCTSPNHFLIRGLVILFGRDDDTVTEQSLEQWGRYGQGGHKMYSFDGGHFYLKQ